MNRILAILVLVGCLVPAFAHEEWQAFSEPFPIRDAIRFDDNLMLATDGGMRLKGPGLDVLYTSEKGLEASVFYGVAQVNGVIFAISEFGLIARYEGERWKVVNDGVAKPHVARVRVDAEAGRIVVETNGAGTMVIVK